MTLEGWNDVRAADAYNDTEATARKWIGRYSASCEAAYADAFSQSMRLPRTIDTGKTLLMVELRKHWMLQGRIARTLGVSESTICRVSERASMTESIDLACRSCSVS